MLKEEFQHFKELVDSAQKIVVMQADNPDGDSLASSLALEHIFGNLGKDVFLYCSIDVPDHLKHLPGWDRVEHHFPSSYDLCVMVDNAASSLLENFRQTSGVDLSRKPFVIIDHHATASTIDYATLQLVDTEAVSAGHVIYKIASALELNIEENIANLLASSILSDTLGLTTDAMTNNSDVLRDLAELVDKGADLAELHQKRLESIKYDRELVAYKGALLQRVEFAYDGLIASVVIPHEEIKEHSMKFNPTIILDELRMVRGVLVTLGFKQYTRDGRIYRVTVRIRCDRSAPIAQDLAEHFGGGGHMYASGIKFESNGLDFESVKIDVLQKAYGLLETLPAQGPRVS